MAQQPPWRGYRAPIEDPEHPRARAGSAAPRRSRRVVLAGILLAGSVVTGCAVLAAHLMDRTPSGLPSIAVGDCLRSAELARGSSNLHDLDTIPCSQLHDAEVFAVRTAAAGDDLGAIGDRCLLDAAAVGLAVADLDRRHLEVRPLALTDADLRPGDTVACFVRHQNGTPLRGAVLTTGSDR